MGSVAGAAGATRDPDTAPMTRTARPSNGIAVLFLAAATILAAGCGARPAIPVARSSAPSHPAASGPVDRLAPVPGAPDHPGSRADDATLVRIVDGDTIRVIVGGVEERVRYIGIDTPEINASSPATPEPYAEAATAANERLLAGGRIVLERDVSERDRFGRLLRNVWVERDGAWTFVNLALVAEGFAQASTFPPDVAYADLLRTAQRTARAEGRGLWGATSP